MAPAKKRVARAKKEVAGDAEMAVKLEQAHIDHANACIAKREEFARQADAVIERYRLEVLQRIAELPEAVRQMKLSDFIHVKPEPETPNEAPVKEDKPVAQQRRTTRQRGASAAPNAAAIQETVRRAPKVPAVSRTIRRGEVAFTATGSPVVAADDSDVEGEAGTAAVLADIMRQDPNDMTPESAQLAKTLRELMLKKLGKENVGTAV